MEGNGHITYRMLAEEEWPKLQAVCPEGFVIPHPSNAIAAVACQGEEIVGVLFAQLVVHVEPLVLQDPHVRFTKLLRLIDDTLPPQAPYYTFAPNSTIGRMAEMVGMEECVGWRVFVKTKGE